MSAGDFKRRGTSRVHRNTYDIDDERAQVHAPLGDDGSFEGSDLTRRALIETVKEAQRMTAEHTPYGRGRITLAAVSAVEVLLDPKCFFDHWSGTNDAANSVIARRGGFKVRTWQRWKGKLKALGVIDYVHRSVRTGLGKAAGVDRDMQISDLYSFSPAKLVPWLREIFDQVHARLVEKAKDKERREGKPRERRPLVKQDRRKCRLPARLNPVGWLRAKAAEAAAHMAPSNSYAAQEARALAFAQQLALRASPG